MTAKEHFVQRRKYINAIKELYISGAICKVLFCKLITDEIEKFN